MSDPAAIKSFLAERDAPCIRCKYNLRGVVGASCPECGWEISLAALQEQEEHRAWRERRMPSDPITSAGTIGAFLGLGWPLVVFLIGSSAIGGVRSGWTMPLVVIAALGQFLVVMKYLKRGGQMVRWRFRRKMWMMLVAWLWGPLVVLVMLAVASL